MSTTLVPYSRAMRLGQGYNTYLQQICVDRAVTFVQEAIQTGVLPPHKPESSPKSDDNGIEQGSTLDDTGTPQVITYKAEFVDNLSDIMEDLNISAAAGIRAGKLSLGGGAAYINERKFKESNINFFINVKVINDKTVLNQELLRFNEIKSVMEDRTKFINTYGDGFISGFISGGELSAIVNIKLMNKNDFLSVKALLQAAMKLPLGNAELPAAHMNLISNQTTETNITVHWTGGGLINESNAEWSILNLLDTAATFPSKVLKFPQRTWAIITKYTHLHDYIEKVQSPIYLEYELAMSYTAILLEDFIEYKLILKSIAATMENPTEYKKTTAKDAYDTDAVSLLKARQKVQWQMARIVMRVNELNLVPGKALDVAKDSLPDEDMRLTDFHLFSARLPVKCKIVEFLHPTIELAPPSIWRPTPRSKLDPIVYNTRDYRNVSTSCLFDSKIYKFSSPRSDPPQFAVGITSLDINKAAYLRLTSKVSKITREGYEVSLGSWADTVKHGAGCTFFEVSQTDSDFQHGRVHTYIPAMYPDGTIISTTWFAPAFAEEVEIVTWLYQIDASCFVAGFLDINTHCESVSRDHCNIQYGACRKIENLHSLCSTWIAYPKHKPGIESERIDKLKFGLVGAANEAQGTLIKEATFKKTFKKPPQVWLALCGMNMTFAGDNLRLRTQVVQDSITTTGFNYEVISWGKNKLETVSLCWLAVELD